MSNIYDRRNMENIAMYFYLGHFFFPKYDILLCYLKTDIQFAILVLIEL